MNLTEVTAAALALMNDEERAPLTALPGNTLAEIVQGISDAWGGIFTAEDLAWELGVCELPEVTTMNGVTYTAEPTDSNDGSALRDQLIARGYDGTLYTLTSVPTADRPPFTTLAYRTDAGEFHPAR